MKQFVTIELDKPRRLRYGINALVLMEELTGKKLTSTAFAEFGIKEIRDVLYCGLMHEDKELTPEKVGELIDEYSDLKTVSEKMSEAISVSFGKGESADGKK